MSNQRPNFYLSRLFTLVLATTVLVVLLPAGLAGAAAAQERTSYLGPEEGETLTSWTERWLDGPVQYIATEDEIATYKQLESTNQRLQFIRLFWERRDPTARDGENEFVDEFVRRVEYANEEFGEGPLSGGGLPGWQTAFGRAVLVLGEPAQTRRELGFPASVSSRPVIIWVYDRRLPPPWPSNEALMFVFQRNRWRMAPPSTLTDPPSAASAGREMERSTPFAQIPNDFVRVTQSLIDEDLVQTVNYNNVVDAVGADVAFLDAEIPFGWEAAFSAGDGGQVDVAIELSWRMETLVFHAVEDNYETEMVAYALVEDEDGEVLAEGTERVNVVIPAAELAARSDEIVQRTLNLSVRPGTYQLRLSLDDHLLGYRSVYKVDLVVPSR